MNKKETAQLLALIAESWCGVEPSEAKVSLWAQLLSETELKEAVGAVHYLIASGLRFAPMVADVKRAIVEIKAPPAYLIEAHQSWQEATYVIENFSHSEGLKRISPLTKEVIEAIGWDELRTGDRDALRGHFIKFFNVAKERWFRDQALPEKMRKQKYQLPQSTKETASLPPPYDPEADLCAREKLAAEIIQKLKQKFMEGGDKNGK